ncbi:MAG: RraA family protein [Acidobacteria bacterium]|nr:RraA family protein [Acidobacteriota bacterium]
MSLMGTLEALRDFDTALLANTIGYIDPTPAQEYYMGGFIQSVTPSLGPTVGVAVTCELDTSSPGGEPALDGYWRQLESMGRTREPIVWVVKTVGSRPDHECVLGDGMAKTLYAQGCVGVVTDGGVRDVNGLLSIPFAAYCRGTVIHHCALRFRRVDEPIEIGGITIRSGDVIHANHEGIIRIPTGCLEILPAKASQMRAFEHDAHCVLRQTDISLGDKRQRVVDLLGDYGFRS